MERRPDLLARATFSPEEKKLLARHGMHPDTKGETGQ